MSILLIIDEVLLVGARRREIWRLHGTHEGVYFISDA